MSYNADGSRVIDARDKSFPASAIGLTTEEFLGDSPGIDAFSTPLVLIDATALQNNLTVMADWVAAHGFELMPHGKTTMAPQIWRRQLALGSTGITVATPWQARVALDAGIPVVMLANECVDHGGLRWVASHLDAHPDQTFYCWADSVAAVAAMEAILDATPPQAPVRVFTELGAPGGRTGARTSDEAKAIAARITASPHMTLAGVAGYEGCLGHNRSPESLDRIRAYLDAMRALFQDLRSQVVGEAPILTVGGSAFFDVVADQLATLAGGAARVVLRSGAYITHDSGFYESISPLGGVLHPDGPHLKAATWGIARVLSNPEPGLALLDGGKRDFPYDEGLPVAVGWSTALGAPVEPMKGNVTALNDQHSFLHVDGDVPPIGAVVHLGLSHPCTTFDKWRLMPVIDQTSALVVDIVETFF